MYTNLKNVQYLISALKAYKINKVVVSPGNSHNSIVRSLEEDNFFSTYNVVDERSAAFFATGLCQELMEPIAICCTAGTAASNYLSGITEAFRRGLPIVVITGDKNPYYFGQYEDQMIDNMSIFDKVTKYSCMLPFVKDEKDSWYCQRILNETLLELNHNGKGPVHIDVPIEDGMLAIDGTFTSTDLPYFKKINRIDLTDEVNDTVCELFNKIYDKKIFIICGQDDHISSEEVELIESISKKYNCIFATDKLSNLHCSGTLEVTRAARAMDRNIEQLFPDIIIYMAGNPCMDYKFRLKNEHEGTELWIVNEDGKIADPFKKLTTVFQGNTIQFLKLMNSCRNKNVKTTYYDEWKEITDKVIIPEFEYSNLYTVQKVMKRMQPNSNFNIANSTTIRITQFFDLDNSIQVYCNRGVNGIDGCVSTFIGQAAASPEKLNYLIVGDLTFFYDMNSIWNRYVGKNVRIMLNNNEGAALFHFNQGGKYPTLNENVAAEHFATAKGWVESQGFKYLSARNKEEFDRNLEEFMCSTSEKPIFFEVCTHKDIDAKVQHEFYDQIILRDFVSATKDNAKKFIKSVLGEEMVNKLKGNR